MVEVVSGVIVQRGRVLLTQRRPDKDFPFAWECPGGKVDGNESHHQALQRELHEELGLDGDQVAVGENAIWTGAFRSGRRHQVIARGERVDIFLLMYPVELSGVLEPSPVEGQGIGWFTAVEMRALQLAPGNRAALEWIVDHMEQRGT